MRKSVNKHQEHSEQTYRSILETAYRFYLEKGIEATTIQEIAQEIGSHRTTVYRYFSNHEEICFAIAQDKHTTLLERYDAELEPHLQKGTGWEKLAMVMKLGDKMAREYRDLFRFYAIFDAYLALRPNQAAVGQLLNNTFVTDKYIVLKKRLIEEGIADGSIRDDLDPELASVTLRNMFVAIWGRIDMRYNVFKYHYNISNPEVIGDVASDIYLAGMRPVKKSQKKKT